MTSTPTAGTTVILFTRSGAKKYEPSRDRQHRVDAATGGAHRQAPRTVRDRGGTGRRGIPDGSARSRAAGAGLQTGGGVAPQTGADRRVSVDKQTTRHYAVRRVNPFEGVLQVVETQGARAYSPNGQT